MKFNRFHREGVAPAFLASLILAGCKKLTCLASPSPPWPRAGTSNGMAPPVLNGTFVGSLQGADRT